MASTEPRLYNELATPESQTEVTTIKVDIVNSTLMKTQMPELGWRPQFGFLYDVVRDAVGGLVGQSTKYEGDAVLVFLPGDDRANEAIASAVEVAQTIAEASQPINGAAGKITFQVTIAITTGCVGMFYDPEGRVDYLGLPIDTAARLCGAASAGAVFADSSTVAAANFNRVSSPIGVALHRTPEQYQGERQTVNLKGIPFPVEYFELWWGKGLYGIRSELVTESATRNTTPARASGTRSLAAEQRATGSGQAGGTPPAKIERCVGRVKQWRPDKKFGFITSNAGEDFFCAPSLMVYPEDVDLLTPGRDVAFVAIPAMVAGKSRRAGALLVLGEDAEGTLTGAIGERDHSWITVHDKSGNTQPVYVSAAELPAECQRGQHLEFAVKTGTRGAFAYEVEVADARVKAA
ncbi:hypothetical protein [Glutamicibacter protophormiae]|uniref:hypothetical protein n=1 Tax=Glutamicibacter protophormiae TaxID=37930 RepID=UPI003A8C8E01